MPKILSISAILTAILIVLGTYIRIYFGAEVTDETYHIACAYLTALGAQFYHNDSYFAQTASLVYEPVIYVYNSLIGSQAVVLFVRHLYLLMAALCAFSFYRLFRKLISWDQALLISLIPLVFIPYSIPTLSYNTIACQGFGIGLAMTLNAALTRRMGLSLLAALAMAISVFVYPSMVLGVGLVYIGLGVRGILRDKKLDRIVAAGALLSGALFFLFWGVTVYRFGHELILESMETTAAYGSLSRFSEKYDHFMSIVGALTPPLWSLMLVTVGLVASAFRWQRYNWLLGVPILIACFLFFTPTRTWSLLSNPFLTFAFCAGLLSLLPVRWSQKDPLEDFSWIVGMACLVLGFAVCMTSSNHVLAMALVTQFGLMFFLAQGAKRSSSHVTIPVLVVLHVTLLFWSFNYVYRDEQFSDMNTMITSGPFAGIVTSESKATLLKQIEDDISEASVNASSILFYDNFPAGYLFMPLRPATRSLFIHPLPYGMWDRSRYTAYYENPMNRPDVFLQFESFPYAKDMVVGYRNQYTQPPYDTFFDYLPGTGDYVMLHQRPHYKVWKKKNL